MAALAPMGEASTKPQTSSIAFPDILTLEDLKRMTAAVTAVERLAEEDIDVEKEAVARVVLHSCCRGLVDPKKLTDVAVMVA